MQSAGHTFKIITLADRGEEGTEQLLGRLLVSDVVKTVPRREEGRTREREEGRNILSGSLVVALDQLPRFFVLLKSKTVCLVYLSGGSCKCLG